MNIRGKLMLGFLGVSLVTAFVGIFGVAGLQVIRAADQQSWDSGISSVPQILGLNKAFQLIRVATRDALLSSDPAGARAAKDAFDTNIAAMEKNFKDYSDLFDDAQDKANFDALYAAWKNSYLPLAQGLIDQGLGSTKAEAIARLRSPESAKTISQFSDLLAALSDYNMVFIKKSVDANRVLTDTSTQVMVGVTGLAILLAIGMGAWFGIFVLSRPLTRSVELLEKVAEGDLTVKGTAKDLARKDEVGALARATETLATNLTRGLTQVADSSAQLKQSSGDLVSLMDKTSDEVGQIDSGIQQVQEHVISQSASIAETSAASEQIVRKLGGLDNLIADQSANVTQSSSAIEEMVANIRSVAQSVEAMAKSYGALNRSSEEGRSRMERVVETIANVASQSDLLQEANDVVNQIAAQTSLLSMNAAIEAAHAGEAGRGFAVVADEIRKLAEVATRQSKEISTNIKTIRGFINSGAEASTVANRTFLDILSQISSLVELSNQVKRAMDEQAEGSQQILQAIGEINKITAEVQNGSTEMLEGGRNISSEMAKLLAASEQVRSRAEELTELNNAVKASVSTVSATGDKTLETSEALTDVVAKFRLGGQASA